jgi:tetratricopeptide (TPR) repeat protein
MLVHARRSGVYREEAWALWLLAEAILIGPKPVSAGLARCEELLADRGELRVGDVGVLGTVALLLAMRGDFQGGRELIGQGRSLMERLDHKSPLLSTMAWLGDLELCAGNWSAADDVLREASEIAADAHLSRRVADLSTVRARALTELGRLDEAQELVEIARTNTGPASRAGQASWRSAQAAVSLARESPETGVVVAREAVRLLRSTDLLCLRADVLLDLANALRACGHADAARRIADEAFGLYTRKENTVGAERARDVLASST